MRFLEIKSPHSHRNSNIQALTDNYSYIYRDSNSKVLVMEDHEYYYQMQTQLLVSKLEKCHFFIWVMKGYCLIEVKANKILQGEIATKCTSLFQNVILPELLSKHFTKNKNHPLVNAENIWCFCWMGKDEDDMIQCDNKNCKIIWLHQKCVRIKQILKGNWYCSECRKLDKSWKKH